jgi:hypothetical protein
VKPDDCIEQLVNFLHEFRTDILVLLHILPKSSEIHCEGYSSKRNTSMPVNRERVVLEMTAKKGVFVISITNSNEVRAASKDAVMLLKRARVTMEERGILVRCSKVS